MTSPRSQCARSHPRPLAFAGLLFALCVLTSIETAAQSSTSAPSPASSPVAVQACGQRLQIGDSSVACLTLIHGSSDAGPIDVSIDGSVLFTGVAFGSSTGFVALQAGTYGIRVTATSQPDTVLFESPGQKFVAGEGIELAIVGSRDATTLAGLILPIQTSTPSAGSASLRVVQAIPDAPPIDLALSSGETIIAGLAPLSASDYLAVPATASSIEILAAGSTDVLFPVPGFTAPDGATITVYSLGSVTNPTGIVLVTVLVPGPGSDAAEPLMVATPAA